MNSKQGEYFCWRISATIYYPCITTLIQKSDFGSINKSRFTKRDSERKTKASRSDISDLNIMTLRSCSDSYRGKDCFWFAAIWNVIWNLTRYEDAIPLWELRRAAHFLILFPCYNQAPRGWPVSWCDKTNYLPQELLWSPLSWGQNNWRPYAGKMIMLRHRPRICGLL